MLSLSEQYALEQKRVDNIISKRLRETLETELSIENVVKSLENIGIGKLRDRLESRKGEILSLFEDFARKQAVIEQAGAMESKKRQSTDKITSLVNGMIKRIVDATLDAFILGENNGAIETSIGMERKVFLDEVLDGNIPIPDIEQETQVPEDRDDR